MLLTSLLNAVREQTKDKLKNLLLNQKCASSVRTKKKIKMENPITDKQPATKEQNKNKDKPLLRKERQQQAAKKKSTPYIPGNVTLQILGTGSNGSPAAVYLFTDQSRYLFNCGEGTQRLAHEHKTKLARLEQIFVTRNTWPTIGGIPGLALTVQDAGVKELALHGPPHLDNILMSMKRFVALKTLQLKTVDCTESLEFEDAVMRVKSIPLYRNPNNDKEFSFEINPSQESIAICYICHLKPRPGALNLEKCVEHGVPPGPLLGLLKNGSDVTLENGKVVKSEDVSEPNENPISFICLDIPSEDFLHNLEKHKDSIVDSTIYNDNTTALPVVLHFSPQDVVSNNIYQEFLGNFAPATQHIFLNSSQSTFSGYISAHRLQYQLNQLNPLVFPILNEATTLLNNLSSKLKKTKLEEVSPKDGENIKRISECSEFEQMLTDLNTMSVYQLRPRKGLDRSNEVRIQPSEYTNETQILEDFPSLLEKLKADFQNRSYPSTSKDRSNYPIISFLGTGSCVPNKTRNVSSILIQPAENSYVLLDCGEGTLGQIQRMFGVSRAQDVIKNLKIIYVSHLHADHHIGLINLLGERIRMGSQNEENKNNKILLMAPKQIESWLNFYHGRIQNIKDAYDLIGNAEMLEDTFEADKKYPDMGIHSIKTCLVKHCPHSFGVKLTLQKMDENANEPITITYSGDTMPCQDLIDLGLNSTILIHEATMENDLEEEARVKTHSTISQAIQQGRIMQAKHIVLTHFSQRYAKLPRLQLKDSEGLENFTASMSNVSIAFDNMQVTLEDLEHFHLMYPAMHSLFAEHAEELEQKALKREMKLERKRKLLST